MNNEEFLEAIVSEAIFRIRREYERTNGRIYLAFSGGKDSTVLAHLIMMANLPTKIPFVFSNTGIELDAILNFVKEFPYENVQIVKPKKPFAQILKENGKPSVSKLKARYISAYHRHIDDPLSLASCRELVTGIREKNGVQMNESSMKRLANKHMHFLHPDTEFKVSDSCCTYLKKKPFEDYAKQNDMWGYYNGMRVSEGGVRSKVIKSCVNVTSKNGHEFYASTPIYDWTDEIINMFIKKYNIRLSDAYEIYGCQRTGCCACPFSKNVKKDLKVLYDYEPKKYKAMMYWMRDVYIYQEVECDWDDEYMEEYNRMKPIIEQRRKEMMDKYRKKD